MKNDTLQIILNVGIAFSKEKNRERLLALNLFEQSKAWLPEDGREKE